MWAYERTGDGTLYLNVTLDHRQDDEHIHSITQVSPHHCAASVTEIGRAHV